MLSANSGPSRSPCLHLSHWRRSDLPPPPILSAARRSSASASHATRSRPAGANRVGPRLAGLFGRTAGSVGDYRYTDALKRSGIVWNDTTLDAYLKDSEAFVPGTKMYGGLTLDADRADLIAYLRRATAP